MTDTRPDADLLAAVLDLTSELDTSALLERLVTASATLTGARFGAINVLDDAGRSFMFVHTGIDPATEVALGHPPRARGVLGQIPDDGVLLLDDLRRHPSFRGMPPGHPEMDSFLGAAVQVDGRRFGAIYLAAKEGGFHDGDVAVLRTLAAAAAVAVRNAERYATERRRTDEAVERGRTYDGLTGLPNRFLAVEQLRRALDTLGRWPGRVAVLYVDIDRFRAVNDTFGLEVGDDVLVQTAARLRELIPPPGIVARLGGDEFLIVCQSVRSERELFAKVDRMLRLLERPVVSTQDPEVVVHPGVSIGVAVSDDPRTPPDRMLHEANAAVDEAKRLGRRRFHVFQQPLGERATRWLRVERELRDALDQDRLVLHYQPIVDLATGTVRGVEALLRMVDPVRGLVPPGEFIDVVEDSALTYPLGDWVMRQASRQLADWQRTTDVGERFTMAVNVTGRQAAEAAHSGSVLQVASEAGVAPGTLYLEVTERTLLDAAESVVDDLDALARAGIKLSIDDFGTGYSSLTYLQRFPVHVLKIDQSFVAGLGVSARDDAIVASVVALGASLGLDVVAEGVETAAQLEALRQLGCPSAQGYHLGRPVPADEIRRLLSGSDS